LSEKSLAYIFPAFVSEYPDDPIHHLDGFADYFLPLLKQGAELVSRDLVQFNFRTRTFLDDELKTQFITYIYSCALSSYLKDMGIPSSYCAGYSMGIYAAFFHSGVISFNDGLELIARAFNSIRKVTLNASFSMGTVIGLTRDDILEILKQTGSRVEITNQNSLCSFVLGGPEEDIRKTLDVAKTEGALSTRVIPVSDPYHTSYINPPGADHRMIMSGIHFNDPAVPVVSLIDRKILKEEQTLRDEIIRNLYTPMNWYKTQLFMQQTGVTIFIECGMGKGLTKNSRFIEGDAVFLSPDSHTFLQDLMQIVPGKIKK
jgi:[acyl-carrier-protein] S-malonyltransferase